MNYKKLITGVTAICVLSAATGATAFAAKNNDKEPIKDSIVVEDTTETTENDEEITEDEESAETPEIEAPAKPVPPVAEDGEDAEKPENPVPPVAEDGKKPVKPGKGPHHKNEIQEDTEIADDEVVTDEITE